MNCMIQQYKIRGIDMSASNKYNKEKRQQLNINFYEKDKKYIEEFSKMPGESNVKRLIHLIKFYQDNNTKT